MSSCVPLASGVVRACHLRALALVIALSIPSWPTPALAAEPDEPAADEPADPDLKERPFRFLVGLKGGGGGELWTEPDNTVLGTEASGAEFSLPLFEETRAGYMVGGGLFLEGIIYEHLGIEVGFHFVNHSLLEDIEWSFTEQRNGVVTTFEADSEQELSWLAFHLPILVKGMVRSGKTRISLGVGPEFAFTMSSSSKFKITNGGLSSTDQNDGTFPFSDCYDGQQRLPGTRCRLERVGTKEVDSVYLAVVFGVEIAAGDFVIPIDIHWSYNFSQESDYLDRVLVDPNEIPNPNQPNASPSGVDLVTRQSMYGGLRVGLAYRF